MKSDAATASQPLISTMDFEESEERRTRRKPNFTVQERMHLAQSYVRNCEEYNRGFTPSTKGEAKIGRQRLLERWATELSSFGIVERTPVEIEQKIRDYMKKIIANRKRAVKRAMSPPCQLISSVVPETSTVEDSTTDDSLTAYAGFLLEQHRATQNDCIENSEPLKSISNRDDNNEGKLMINTASNICFGTKEVKKVDRKRKASSTALFINEKEENSVGVLDPTEEIPVTSKSRKQQINITQADLALKNLYLDIARKELEKRQLEVEAVKIDLHIKQLELEDRRCELEKKRLQLEQLRRNFNLIP